MPVVTSLSGSSGSMPIRKLLPNEMRLMNNTDSPAMQKSTPTHETNSDRKNSCLLTLGKWNAAANTA